MRYENHLVAFLDILGFSNLCLKSENDQASYDNLSEIYSICEQIPHDFDNRIGKTKIKTIIVSDSIMLTLKSEGELPSQNECANFFLACGQVQFKLAEKGYWLRGGISFGKLHVNESKKLLFGPAFIKAVNLEKNIAKYPRIIVDSIFINLLDFRSASELINNLNSIYKDQLPLFNYSRSFFETDRPTINKDVPLFIDYLNSVKQLDHKEFMELAEIICRDLNGSIEYYEKYRWLADYLLSAHRKYNLNVSAYVEEIEGLLT